MKNPSNNLRKLRIDLSPYLFTFLKDEHPCEILHEILTSGVLKSEKHNYICFTDAPITCYLPNLEYFEKWKNKGYNAMYSKYGIGISRDWLINNMGARPVIYGDASEEEKLHESIKWRFLTLDVEKYDYTWLREWRIPQKELNLYEIPREHLIIIAPTEEKLKDFIVGWDYDVDVIEGEPGEVWPLCVYEKSTEKREWKGIAINQIQEFTNDYALSSHTESQFIGENLRTRNE